MAGRRREGAPGPTSSRWPRCGRVKTAGVRPRGRLGVGPLSSARQRADEAAIRHRATRSVRNGPCASAPRRRCRARPRCRRVVPGWDRGRLGRGARTGDRLRRAPGLERADRLPPPPKRAVLHQHASRAGQPRLSRRGALGRVRDREGACAAHRSRHLAARPITPRALASAEAARGRCAETALRRLPDGDECPHRPRGVRARDLATTRADAASRRAAVPRRPASLARCWSPTSRTFLRTAGPAPAPRPVGAAGRRADGGASRGGARGLPGQRPRCGGARAGALRGRRRGSPGQARARAPCSRERPRAGCENRPSRRPASWRRPGRR
jgi:hypothetical protein